MKNIDLIIHFLNDAPMNEVFIKEFEIQILRQNYNIPLEEKLEAMKNIKDELDTLIRELVADHANCSDFLSWLTDYIIPEVVTDRDFKLHIATADIEQGMDFEEDLRTRIATVLYNHFYTKNIFYLQVCQYIDCGKIYIPKRLNKAAKFCNEDCKHAYWIENHPEKKKEYKNKRKSISK